MSAGRHWHRRYDRPLRCCPGSRAQHTRFNGKIDVLGNVAGRFGKFERVQFRSDHPDNLTVSIEQRAAAVAGLNGSADLQVPGIV